MVTARMSGISFVSFITLAMAMAPNATWESPSPINENLRRTSVTPRSEEQSAMRTPTINAFLTNGYWRYSISLSILLASSLQIAPACLAFGKIIFIAKEKMFSYI